MNKREQARWNHALKLTDKYNKLFKANHCVAYHDDDVVGIEPMITVNQIRDWYEMAIGPFTIVTTEPYAPDAVFSMTIEDITNQFKRII